MELGFSATTREMLTFRLRNTSPKKHAVMNATPRVEKYALIVQQTMAAAAAAGEGYICECKLIIEGDPVDCINIWILGAGQSEDTV